MVEGGFCGEEEGGGGVVAQFLSSRHEAYDQGDRPM